MIPGQWSKPAATGLPRQWLLALAGSRARLRILAQTIPLASPEQVDAATFAFLSVATASTHAEPSTRSALLLGTQGLLRAFAKLGDEARNAAVASGLPWQDAASELLLETEREPNRQRQNRAHAALLMASLHLAAAGRMRAPVSHVLRSHDSEARRVGVAIVRTFLDSDDGSAPLRAELACQALGDGIAHLSADQLSEACEAIGIAFRQVQLGGGSLARALAPALAPTTETEAARLLLRGKLRRDRTSAWYNAAWSLATFPSVAAAAAERLIQDAAAGSIDPGRSHLLAHPGRVAALWRAHGQQREPRDLVIAEQALLNPGASAQVSTALAKLALGLCLPPRPHRGSVGSLRASGSNGSSGGGQTNKSLRAQATTGGTRTEEGPAQRDRVALLLLRSPVSSVRQSAVRVLARSASWTALGTSLRDPSPAIARTAEAVVAVRSGLTGRKLAIQALAAAHVGEQQPVRWLARSASRPGRLVTPDALPGETLSANDHAMAQELLKLRRQVPSPETTEAVVELVCDLLPNQAAFERTISAALPAVAWHRGDEGTELLRKMLHSPHARLRAGAFEALTKRARIIGSVSLQRETPVLLRAGLSDVHHRVRGSCLRGLIESSITEVKPLIHRNLLAMASDCEALEQLTALYVIGRSAPSLAGEAAIGHALKAAIESPANAIVEIKATAISQSIEYLRRTGQGTAPPALLTALSREEAQGVAA